MSSIRKALLLVDQAADQRQAALRDAHRGHSPCHAAVAAAMMAGLSYHEMLLDPLLAIHLPQDKDRPHA